MVNPQHILEIARSQGMRAFRVYDGRMEIVHVSDTPAGTEEKIRELDQFMKNASGMYKVQLRNKAGLGDYPTPRKALKESIIGEYDVLLERPRQGISGLDITAGLPSFEMIQRYEQQIRDLDRQNARLENEVYNLKNQIDNMKARHEDEVRTIKSSDHKIAGYIGQLSSLINPGALVNKVNGIGAIQTEQTESNTMTTESKKERIIKAINRLVELDPDFADNIEKLVKVRENKPETYQMAVGMLDNF